MESDWKITIFTGPLDREWLVAEISYKGEEWAELSEFGKTITLFGRSDNSPWILPYDEVIHILENAKDEVVENPAEDTPKG